MATPSPLNFNQRGKAASPRGFTTAEDYASQQAALNSGPTGMHEKNTIQSGPHKGKTPDQVYAEYLDAGVALGIPRRSVDGSTNGRLLLGQAPGQSPAPGSSPVAPVSPRAASPVAPAPAASPAAPAAPMAAAPRPASKPKSFDGMSATQFGAQAAARQGRGNSFTGYQQFSYADPFQPAAAGTTAPQVAASPSAMGPAQKAQADFNAANPNVKTQAEIDQMQQTFKANRDNLTAIQAQKGYAAQREAAASQPVISPPAAVSPTSAVADTIRGNLPGAKDRVTTLNGRPYKSPLMADMAPAAASPTKPAGTPLSAVKPFAQVAVRPSTSLKPTLSLPSTSPAQPLIAGARAEGGPVEKGKAYLVGEKGPEVVVPKPQPSMVDQALLGVVHTGGKIAQGAAGLVSMAANAKIKEAENYETGKTEHSSFVPIAERYKEDPWYKRIPKQIGDAMAISPRAPEVEKYVKETSGKWASDGKTTLKNIKNAADNIHTKVGTTNAAIEPQMGNTGKATAFASSLIPGVRALDIPLGIGEAKGAAGGVIPTLAAVATRKMPGGDLARNAVQQSLSNGAQSLLPARAEGGPVQAGKPYLVGERGPEIVVPAQNATVIPNHAVNPRLLTPRSRAVSPSQDWRSPTRPVKAARPSLVTMR